MRVREQNLLRFLVSALMALLPFGPAIPNIIIGVIIALGFLLMARGKMRLQKSQAYTFWVVNGFVFFHLFSVAWSENIESGIEKSASLLPIPALFLVVASCPMLLKWKEVSRFILLFTLGIFVLSMGSLIAALGREGPTLTGINQQSLATAWLDFHYLGFSFYLGLALVLCIQLLIFRKNLLPPVVRKLLPFALVFLAGILVLLSSRSTLAVTGLLITIQCYFGWKKNKPSGRTILFASVSLLVLIGLGMSNQVLRVKVNEALNQDNQYSISEHWGGRGFRQLIWNCAFHLIEEHPIYGVGIGDQKDAMDLCYRHYRYQALLFNNNNFNAHNIFLQAAVATGLIGLFLFCAAFLYQAWIALLRKHWIYLVFLAMLVGTGLTESHFNRNAIVSIFAILNPILFLIHSRDDESSSAA